MTLAPESAPPGARCVHCRLHRAACICAIVPRIETRTRVVLVLHRAEARKSTNTGRLALLCLPNSAVWMRGECGERDRRSAGHP